MSTTTRSPGGTAGAARDFELDYWVTSYAEAMRLLNRSLPPGSTVAFWGTSGTALPYAREDLIVRSFSLPDDPITVSSDVVVISTRANADLGILPDAPLLAEITVDGAPLAVIRRVPKP